MRVCCGGMLVGFGAVVVGGSGVLLGLIVLTQAVMMGSGMMMVLGSGMMRGGLMMMLFRGVRGCHWILLRGVPGKVVCDLSHGVVAQCMASTAAESLALV